MPVDISRCSGTSLHTLLQHTHTMPAILPVDLNSNAQFGNAEVCLHFTTKDEISGALMATTRAY